MEYLVVLHDVSELWHPLGSLHCHQNLVWYEQIRLPVFDRCQAFHSNKTVVEHGRIAYFWSNYSILGTPLTESFVLLELFF